VETYWNNQNLLGQERDKWEAEVLEKDAKFKEDIEEIMACSLELLNPKSCRT
jgi:hypothetical protein